MGNVTSNIEEIYWEEKYRPHNIDECILKPSIKSTLKSIVEDGIITNNMMFYGSSGTGKTTAARAICEQLGYEYIIVNASDERGLDVIRERIKNFASTVSMMDGGRKCFILDEADSLLPDTQKALRRASEEYSKNCSFIMTANFPNRIIEAIHSRFVTIEFGVGKEDEEQMQAEIFMRLSEVLNQENVDYDENVLVKVVQKMFPDTRKMLNRLQYHSRRGKIDTGMLMDVQDVSFDTLIKAMQEGSFKDVKQWCAENANNDTSSLYERLYKSMKDFVADKSKPDAIMIFEDYQRHDATVPSKELHLAALCTELMTSLEIKK